jgi:hypothetical protein
MASKNQLRFTMQFQTQTNWCWAANAASISLFYDSGSAWTQCKVASIAMQPTNCCVSPLPCNNPWLLDGALKITHNFVEPLIYGPMDLNGIQEQIDAGLVIGSRIGWSGGGGHFVSVYGYDRTGAEPFIFVADPIYGTTFIKLSTFISSYQASGRWTHSYLTKATQNTMIEFSHIDHNLFAKAEEMKGRLGDESSFKSTEAPSSNAIQQEVFVISLDSLKAGGEPKLINTGVRLIDNSKSSNGLIYDFDSIGPAATIQQVINDRSYSSRYFKAITKVSTKQKNDRNYFNLDVIRIPELKLEALWLHSKTDFHQDQYIPVFSATELRDNVTYSREDFLKIVRHEARNLRDYDNPLYGG